jgi:hypothetical protein
MRSSKEKDSLYKAIKCASVQYEIKVVLHEIEQEANSQKIDRFVCEFMICAICLVLEHKTQIAKRDQKVFDLLKGFSNEKDLLESRNSEYSEILVKAEQLSSQTSVLNDLCCPQHWRIDLCL